MSGPVGCLRSSGSGNSALSPAGTFVLEVDVGNNPDCRRTVAAVAINHLYSFVNPNRVTKDRKFL